MGRVLCMRVDPNTIPPESAAKLRERLGEDVEFVYVAPQSKGELAAALEDGDVLYVTPDCRVRQGNSRGLHNSQR